VLRPFTLERPSTLGEIVDLLSVHPAESALYAGGTELLLLMKEGLIRPRRLIDVKAVRDLEAITADDGTLTIGATVRHRDVERAALVQERCPLVAGVARHVANVRVRSVGTVGGNLAFADPHSDLATLFLALDGTLHLWSRRGTREVPLADFIRGPYETAREEDEVLTSVRLRTWPSQTAAAYLKFGVYERPTLGVTVACEPKALRVTVGCVGPRPQRLFEVERKGDGEPAADLLAKAEELGAAAAREVDTVADRHGSAEYKRALTGTCVKRALQVAAARAQGQVVQARYAYTVIV
jgi:carbon-monoxide dehydrogenase medium subunit